jgi:hypothetical protein
MPALVFCRRWLHRYPSATASGLPGACPACPTQDGCVVAITRTSRIQLVLVGMQKTILGPYRHIRPAGRLEVYPQALTDRRTDGQASRQADGRYRCTDTIGLIHSSLESRMSTCKAPWAPCPALGEALADPSIRLLVCQALGEALADPSTRLSVCQALGEVLADPEEGQRPRVHSEGAAGGAMRRAAACGRGGTKERQLPPGPRRPLPLRAPRLCPATSDGATGFVML